MDMPARDGDGYLVDMNAWEPEVGMAMAEADGFEMTAEKWAALAISCVTRSVDGTPAGRRIGRPHSGARDREPGCQRSRGSSRGAGKRDRRLSHQPR